MHQSLFLPSGAVSFLLLLGMTACGHSPPRPAASLHPELGPLEPLVTGRRIIYAHVVPEAGLGGRVTPSTPLGVVEELPVVQSSGHQALLIAARSLYEQGRFLEAAVTVRPALGDEPENPFVLNEYARALFRVDSLRHESRPVYEKLISIVTTAQPLLPGAIVVDMWFVDAYWKLALLYLDIEKYDRALVELTRVVLARPQAPTFREELYSYLAEAFFHMGQRPAAQWFVDRTLALNPNNSYVLQFRTSE